MDVLFKFVATLLIGIRDILLGLNIAGGGISWALAIIILSLIVRVLLLPLNIKQFHSQRSITKVQPELQKLNAAYKKKLADLQRAPMNPEKRSEETRKAQLDHLSNTKAVSKKHGFSASGFLVPLLVQGIIGIALFRVITEFRPGAIPKYGISAENLISGANAEIFGTPLASKVTSTAMQLANLNAGAGARIVALLLVLLVIGITTLSLQKNLKRSMPQAAVQSDDPMEQMMANMMGKARKYGVFVLPLILLPVYLFLPVGVMLNILVIVIWSFGYQTFMMRRHPLEATATTTAVKAAAEVSAGDTAPGVQSAVESTVTAAKTSVKTKSPSRTTPSRNTSKKKRSKKRR